MQIKEQDSISVGQYRFTPQQYNFSTSGNSLNQVGVRVGFNHTKSGLNLDNFDHAQRR